MSRTPSCDWRLISGAGGGHTIYRPYEPGDAEKHFWKNRTPEEHLKWIQAHDAPEWIWFQIGNEPTLKTEKDVRDMCKWLAQFIRLCVAAGIRCVVYNPSVGSFDKWQIDAGWFDELLIELAKQAHRVVDGWPQFILGSHSCAYWMGVAAVHCAGGNPNDLIRPEKLTKDHWPTQEQVFDADTSDNWILFRDWWFIQRARKLASGQQINEGMDIRIAGTEAGPENLPNIRTQFPDVVKKMDEICGREYRGARTATKYYEWAFPGQSAAEGLCNDFSFVDTIAPDVYLMFGWFTWSDHNVAPDWWGRDYNARELRDVLTLWPKRQQLETPPAPLPYPSLPLPGTQTPYEEHTNRSGDDWRLRARPELAALPEIGWIKQGETFYIVPGVEYQGWLQAKNAAGVIGWSDKGVLGSDDAPFDTPKLIQQLRAALPGIERRIGEFGADIVALNVRRASVAAELADLDEKISDKSHARSELFNSKTLVELTIQDLERSLVEEVVP